MRSEFIHLRQKLSSQHFAIFCLWVVITIDSRYLLHVVLSNRSVSYASTWRIIMHLLVSKGKSLVMHCRCGWSKFLYSASTSGAAGATSNLQERSNMPPEIAVGPDGYKADLILAPDWQIVHHSCGPTSNIRNRENEQRFANYTQQKVNNILGAEISRDNQHMSGGGEEFGEFCVSGRSV